MSQFIETAQQIVEHGAPGAAIGYMVGQGLEQIARHDITANRQAIVGVHEGIVPEQSQSVLRRGFAHLAMVGALTGFAANEAITPPTIAHGDKPVVVMAVDHSFGTRRDQDKSIVTINDLAKRVARTDSLGVKGLLAHNSHVTSTSDTAQIEADNGYSASVMPDAVEQAIDNVSINATTSEASGLQARIQHRGGVLAITDGNSIGNAKTVIAKAKEQGNTPIFIADVSKKQTKATNDLKVIAKQTGGMYWSADTKPADIVKALEAQAKPVEADQDTSGERALSGMMALMLGALTVAKFRKRKHETAASS